MMQKLTSKDKDGRILVNGIYKVCNIASDCSYSECNNGCVIDAMIKRLYELEHTQNQKDTPKHEFSEW